MADISAPVSSIFRQIPIDRIRPAAHQARKNFDEAAIQGLAESMKVEGLMQPITVRPLSQDQYELVSGERRFRAAKLLGWSAIEAKVIETVSEGEAAAKGLIENLQRENLNPIEEAEGIKAILDLHDNHWTQAEIGKVVGRQQSEISEMVRFLDLSEPIKENIRRLIITYGHATALIRLPSNELREIVAKKIEKGLSVKATRELVAKLLNPKGKKHQREEQAQLPAITFTRTDNQIKFSGSVPLTLYMDEVVRQFREALGLWNMQSMGKGSESLKPPTTPATVEKASHAEERTGASRLVSPLPRFPSTPEEEAELQELALQGPAAIYKWVFGEQANKMPGIQSLSWKNFNVDDPQVGLKELLAALKA